MGKKRAHELPKCAGCAEKVSRVQGELPANSACSSERLTIFISDQNLYFQYAPPSLVSHSLHKSGKRVKLLVRGRLIDVGI